MGEYQPPYLAKGPVTLEGRSHELRNASKEVFARYYVRAVRNRAWNPNELPFGEMQSLGSKLSEDTVTLLEGFLGVEEFIGDYVLAGLNEYRGDRTFESIILHWGGDESKHGEGLELSLLHSKRRTQPQVDEYYERLSQNRWSPDQHPGVDGLFGATTFQVIQERGTYVDYRRLRSRVRAEYGLSDHRSPRELRWGREIGVSETLSRISLDEIAHYGLFLGLLLAQLKYFPDEVTEKIIEVKGNFKMPALTILPNRMAFLRAVRRTGIDSAEMQQAEVFRPFLKAVGLDEKL